MFACGCVESRCRAADDSLIPSLRCSSSLMLREGGAVVSVPHPTPAGSRNFIGLLGPVPPPLRLNLYKLGFSQP